MARYPTKVDFAKKPSTKDETPDRRQKYLADRLKNDWKRLKKALANKSKLIMIQANGNYVRVYRLGERPFDICQPFEAACSLLKGKLFYQPIRGRLVNLAHWDGFDEDCPPVKILLSDKLFATLNRDEVRKLPQLKLYLSSNEYINARKRQLVI
jgi:hypothetical protein